MKYKIYKGTKFLGEFIPADDLDIENIKTEIEDIFSDLKWE